MKKLYIPLSIIALSMSILISACSTDDDETPTSNPVANNNTQTATCTDGIQNQDETGVDCGGVCPACPSSSTAFSLKLDGVEKGSNELDAYRTINQIPNSITLIAVIDGNRYSIHLQEPDIVGWSGGLSLSSLTAPDAITVEMTDNMGNPTSYSTTDSGSEELSFIYLEFEKGGRVEGSFSGELFDGSGNMINLTDGKFETTFED